MLGTPYIIGEGSGESETESEQETPHTQLSSDSESETNETSTRHILLNPLDTVYKASLHLRRAMVRPSPLLILKHFSFFGLDASDIVIFEYFCRFWPIVENFGHLSNGCVRSFGISLTLLHFWWSVAKALKLPVH